jgi:predicted nucleic acid-binding protein
LSEIIVAREGERLYLDSMVIIGFLKKDHRLHAKATDIMAKIEKMKFEGIISSLTLMEFIKILRDALIKAGMTDMKQIEDTIREMVKALYCIENLYFVEGRPPEFSLMDEIKTVYFHSISQNAFEMICKYCGRRRDSSKGAEHYGLSPMDVLHLALAKKLGCDKIVTDDWAFKDAETEMTPLLLTDSYAFW